MSNAVSRAVGVLAALALGAGLAGCAGSGERLPQCKGKPVPINATQPHTASTARVSESDAH